MRTVIVDRAPIMEDRILRFLDPDQEIVMCRKAQTASLAILERAGLDRARG